MMMDNDIVDTTGTLVDCWVHDPTTQSSSSDSQLNMNNNNNSNNSNDIQQCNNDTNSDQHETSTHLHDLISSSHHHHHHHHQYDSSHHQEYQQHHDSSTGVQQPSTGDLNLQPSDQNDLSLTSVDTEELLVGGQPTSGAVPGAGHAASASGSGSCCENGRPIMTDPVSGQSVCSCQYDSARLALSSYPRLSSYGSPYPSSDQNPYPSIGVDSSAFYSPLSNPYGLKDGSSTADVTAWTSAGLQPTTGYYPYDPTLAAYGYGAGYDLAARRKNATRESTATLKAWLNEHKKNPYPTKGEKIMLAIITKMTLTQVSTWFANARRRLKKENKMTWEPKNKTDDDDDAMVSDGDMDDCKDRLDDISRPEMRVDAHHKMDDKGGVLMGHHHVKPELHHRGLGMMDDDDDLDDDDGRKPLMLKDEIKSDCGVPIPATKPKIWSLADTAACKTPPPSAQMSTQPWLPGVNSFALPAAMSPSAAAAAPYSRYGGLLGSSAGPYAGGGGGGGPSACSVAASGFPEVQTDTPPQTPPNMKLPSVAGNLITGPGNSSCFGSQHHNMAQQQQQQQQYGGQQGGYGGYARMPASPHKERPKDISSYHQPHHQHHMMNGGGGSGATATMQGATEASTAFKPFYKSPHPLSGFVSPV